jgi:superfamily II RNA helicase
MTGRAGRRGMDNIGFAVAIPGKFMDIRLEAKLISSPPSDVSSQIRINFSMVLNLLLSHTPDQIEDLLKKSFATYLLIQGRKKKTVTGPRADDHKFLWANFLQHLNFLKETKYVAENNKLTETGIWASQLRVDQPLMIAEGLKRKIFPESDPAILAAIIASFVDEQESDDKSVKNLVPGTLLASFQKVKKGLRSFTKHMIERGFAVRPLFLKPAATIYAWATGQPWEKVLAVSETAEGNLAMLILRTADNLRHIRSLTQVFPAAAKTSETAIELILRDPVVMDYDL